MSERVRHWLDVGALPSDRVARFLGAAEIIPMPAQRNNPQKAQPKAKALERQAARAEKAAAAASAQAEAPAEAAPEEAAPEEAAPEEAAPEEAAPEEAALEEGCSRRGRTRRGRTRRGCARGVRRRRDRRRRVQHRRWRGQRESRRLRPRPAHMAELPRRSSRHRQGKVGRRRSASGGSWVPTACAASCALQSYAVNPDDLTAYGALSDASDARRFTLSVTGHVKGLLPGPHRGCGGSQRGGGAARHRPPYRARGVADDGGRGVLPRRSPRPPSRECGGPTPSARSARYTDHGAGPIVEIQPPDGPSTFLPFTREHVPAIDIEAGRMVVVVAAEDGS